ncbi:lantibiotic dehydratase [Guptibacillus hwajinpoensis]|uniref:lantibiotic dehydratase n=1 Tax=Guptibacillus hwajinpoensis TaxID=208199 RepID=UPI00069F726D|nr:lantibiotic dehydratase [Alkalihalobacillus macyae]
MGLDKFSQKTSQLYGTMDYFMLRAPLLPISESYGHAGSDSFIANIKMISDMPEVKEAIAVSSPTLYKSLHKLNGDPKSKKTRNAISSVMKFLIRMSTRPTPFGLFSGFASGHFSEETMGNIGEIDQHIKRARPDMEWLLGIVGIAEDEYSIVKDVKVKVNDTVYFVGERVYLGYHSNGGRKSNNDKVEKTENISIKYSEAVEKVFAHANGYIYFSDLVGNIHEAYPGVEKDQIRDFIWKLFKEEFLISELRPPFTNTNSFTYIINKLKNVDGAKTLVDELVEIAREIDVYNSLSIGEGLEKYEQITSNMKSLHKINTPLQVDVKLHFPEEVKIHKNVKQDAAFAAELLWKLSEPTIGYKHLKDYHMEFIEKYGTNREISVLELLSEEKGLGAPATYKHPQGFRSFSDDHYSNSQMDRLLFGKYHECVASESLEVVLTESELQPILDDETVDMFAPDSGELYTELLSPSKEDLDNGDYLLAIGSNAASMEVGQTFGRFSDMLDEHSLLNITNDQREIQKNFTDDSVEFVEATFLPNSGRTGNVSVNYSSQKFELALGTNTSSSGKSIAIHDIMVGATLGRLYLKSKSLNKRLVIKSNNMFNFNNAPNIYRFLQEVSKEDTKPIKPFNWGVLEHSPFLPRVRVGRLILNPALWKINQSIVELADPDLDFQEWKKNFEEWKAKWKVPEVVFLTFGDNRILIDLQNDFHLKELRGELRKKGRVQLREVISNYKDHHWVKNNSRSYNSELIIPFKKNEVVHPKPKVRLLTTSEISEEDIYKEIGSEWLYFKIYLPFSRQEPLIAQEFYEFVKTIKSQKGVENVFFIRYQDPQPHIRLRMKGAPEELIGSVLPKFRNWFNVTKQKGYVRDFSINTFEREIERYGGLGLIDTIEDYFEVDSFIAIELLKMKKFNQLEFDLPYIAAMNILHLLDKIGWPYDKQLTWIKTGTDKLDYIDEVRPIRKELVSRTLPFDGWAHLQKSDYNLYKLLSMKDQILSVLAEKIDRNLETNSLTNNPERIIGSLIHMHCNRIFGTNRELEKKVMATVRHVLEGQKYWREQERESVYSRSI